MKFIHPVPQVPAGYPRPHWDYFNAPGRIGYNPNYSQPGDPSGHDGVDLKATYGSKILASIGEDVHDAGFLNIGAGWGVESVLRDEDGFRGEAGWWGLRYLHMKKSGILVSIGDTITQGQHIGDIGLTGQTRYPHTHFEIKWLTVCNPNEGLVSQGIPLDPLPFISWFPPAEKIVVTIMRSVLRIQTPPYTTDPAVQDLQHFLNQARLLDLTPGVNFNPLTMDWDGKHGPSTDDAVRTWQALEGLTIDGIVGEATWESLLGY